MKQEANRTGGGMMPPADGARYNTAEHKKRPYEPPALVVWGTLRDITQSVGFNGANDGGRGSRRRTR